MLALAADSPGAAYDSPGAHLAPLWIELWRGARLGRLRRLGRLGRLGRPGRRALL